MFIGDGATVQCCGGFWLDHRTHSIKHVGHYNKSDDFFTNCFIRNALGEVERSSMWLDLFWTATYLCIFTNCWRITGHF